MMTIHAEWNGKSSFRLIPIDSSCPYTEAVYDNINNILVIIGKDKRQKPHMLPVLNKTGDAIVKKSNPETGIEYAQERVYFETYQEYYITNNEDIKFFIKGISINDKHDSLTILDTK